MYMKYMLRDWTSAHLLDCAWYLDYPKENAPTSKFKIQEIHEPKFLQGHGALEKETSSKKKFKGGERRGKRQVQGFGSKCKIRSVPTQSQIKTKLGLAVTSFQEVPMISIRTIPTEVNDATINA